MNSEQAMTLLSSWLSELKMSELISRRLSIFSYKDSLIVKTWTRLSIKLSIIYVISGLNNFLPGWKRLKGNSKGQMVPTWSKFHFRLNALFLLPLIEESWGKYVSRRSFSSRTWMKVHLPRPGRASTFPNSPPLSHERKFQLSQGLRSSFQHCQERVMRAYKRSWIPVKD